MIENRGQRKGMGRLNGLRNLRVHQRSLKKVKRIFELTQDFPSDERFSPTDQMQWSPGGGASGGDVGASAL